MCASHFCDLNIQYFYLLHISLRILLLGNKIIPISSLAPIHVL